jgi:hypothetical protein
MLSLGSGSSQAHTQGKVDPSWEEIPGGVSLPITATVPRKRAAPKKAGARKKARVAEEGDEGEEVSGCVRCQRGEVGSSVVIVAACWLIFSVWSPLG